LYNTAGGIDEKEKGELDSLGGIKTTGVGRWKDSNCGASTACAKTTAVADDCYEGRIFGVIELKTEGRA
jgi:hypothetical protein